MPNTTIEQLELEIKSNSQSAVQGIEALSTSLSKLKLATKGGVGLTSVAKQISNINSALNSMSGDSPQKLSRLADSLQKLKGLGNIKLSTSIGNQIRNLSGAISSLSSVNMGSLKDLADSLKPLTNIGKNNLSTFVTQLKKIPDVVKALDSNTIAQFTAKIQQLVTALSPLANQLNTIGNAMSRLPQQIRNTTSATNSLNNANSNGSKGYANLWAKARMAYNAVRTASHFIASCITESNSYIENINLFTASMGDYAEEAKKYAETVGEVMGIDPGQFMRYQGVFMTITKGFGVVEDKAYKMSKNLTQLGYDLSSFFNISFEDSMQKLQSGISGELEPLRRLGYDLSIARLQQEALNLGITKSVNAMTQAEKSQLRYYAIMTQVTQAQGDMARTLNAPANQLRILQAQVTQCARAIGNMFIPVLNAVLPYLIAFAKVVRMVINMIGKFVGFELPEVDYSSISAGSNAMGDLTDNTDDATKAAKKLKNAMTGIDELNIISENDSGSSGASDLGLGGSDLGIELPEYNFLDDAINSRVDDLVKKFKEWAGLTDDIDTWAEFLHTKLGRILVLVAEIAAGLALWKLSKAFLNGLNWFKTLSEGLGGTVSIATGVVLTLTGLTIEFTGIKSIIEDGIDSLNLGETVGGAILTAIGGTFIGKGASAALLKAGITSSAVANGVGAGLAGALFGGGIAAVVAGLPAFGAGIYSAIKEGLNFLNGFLVEFGATLTGAGAGAIGAALGAWGGPVGIAVGALIGVVVGALTDLGIYLYQNWDDVKEWASGVGSTMKKFFTVTVPNFFKKLPSTIKSKWDKALDSIREFDWKQLGYDVGKKVGGFVKDVCDSIKTFFTETLPDTWDSVKSAFGTFFGKTLPKLFTETIPDFFTTVGDSFEKFFTETLPDTLSNIGSWFVDVGKAIWDGIKEGWDTAITAISDFVTGFVDGFKEALGIHSPSTVFRDEVGKFLGEGLLEGILKPLENLKQWVIDHIIDPIQSVVKSNPIKQGIELIKEKWTTVSNWIGNIPTLSQYIKLLKERWTTVKDWIGNIPTLSQYIKLMKEKWTTISNWIGTIPILSQFIALAKSAWTTVSAWVSNFLGSTVNKAIGLAKSGWSTVAEWVQDKIGGTVSVTVNLLKGWAGTIKSWLGFENGGVMTDKGVHFAANGGVFGRGIPMYANGTNDPTHGSLFVAGENGAEMVGHIRGRTEVMNRFQLADVMYNAMIGGMTPFANAMVRQMAASANAIINAVRTVDYDVSTQVYYDPTGTLSQTVYEESETARRSTSSSMYSDMRDFYRDYVEPSVIRMVNATERQADKDEQTIVQIGNRTITDAVERQNNANGYKFATT